MSTGSTKRARKGKGQQAAKAQQKASAPKASAPKAQAAQARESSASKAQARASVRVDASPAHALGEEIPERAWLVASLVILMAATAFRIYALDLKPMHHDEGVNGFFLTNLLRQGVYHYDPANYHGPTLYYLTLPIVALFGLNTFAVRFVTAAFGIATVWLVLSLRRWVGAVGALTAAALVAVSPACVFYSRYFIHESLFVFFALGIVVAALRFYETGAATYLLLASASAAMLFATKETAFISVGTLALAWLVAVAWATLTSDARGARGRKKNAGGDKGLAQFVAGGQAPLAFAFAFAFALFAFIWILFYSSFFTYWKGVFWDSFEAFRVWKQTGMSEFHSKPLDTYVRWLWQEEAPILLLAVVGTLVALFERRKNRFAIFAGAWGFGLLAAYSLISYKTPWLVLSFVVPLAVIGGYGVQAVGRWAAGGGSRLAAAQRRAVTLVVVAVALVVCVYQAFVVNFREYDNDRYIYVYSHTQRQALDMLKEVERASARADTKEPGIIVASPEYWPLPWYFRDNSHVGYLGSVAPFYDPKSTLMVIGRKSDNPKEDQYEQLRRVLTADYVEAGTYPLRPGVMLVLFERRDLAGK
ncbi:MAG TPA: flippase activity-associated protein Agl23 [Pyrinomonadaceae bacterium]|nr:flippase activity-associated protein Agl23 [Pyrinomonadaceae bacterium]